MDSPGKQGSPHQGESHNHEAGHQSKPQVPTCTKDSSGASSTTTTTTQAVAGTSGAGGVHHNPDMAPHQGMPNLHGPFGPQGFMGPPPQGGPPHTPFSATGPTFGPPDGMQNMMQNMQNMMSMMPMMSMMQMPMLHQMQQQMFGNMGGFQPPNQGFPNPPTPAQSDTGSTRPSTPGSVSGSVKSGTSNLASKKFRDRDYSPSGSDNDSVYSENDEDGVSLSPNGSDFSELPSSDESASEKKEKKEKKVKKKKRTPNPT